MIDSIRLESATIHVLARQRAFALCVAAIASACGSTPPTDQNQEPSVFDDLPSIDLSQGLIRHIGVVDGDQEYQFFRITGAVRLTSGALVIANSGTRELRFYDADGTYSRRVGGFGGGPGEFRDLKGVFRLGGDTLMAYDMAGRKSFFNTSGQFLTSENVVMSADRFPMDVWMYRHNWVEGVPATLNARRTAAAALDRLPRPSVSPRYRFARIDEGGNLWVGSERARDGSWQTWSVYTPDGVPLTRVRVPDRFRILGIESDAVLGVWRDGNDVEFVRVYALSLPDAPEPTPVVADEPSNAPLAEDSVSLATLARDARSLLRNMVTAQERFFYDHLRYTADVTELELETAEFMAIDLLSVGSTGWLAVVTHEHASGICGIGLGTHTPAGWSEGVATCADLTLEDIRRSVTP